MASEVLNPIQYPAAWDQVQIGTTYSPGRCVVKGFKRKYTWDIKKGKGIKGATSTFTQAPPVEGTITFYLWTTQHFIDWGTFRPLFKYDPTKKAPKAFTMFYPSLDDIDASLFVCDDIGAIEESDVPTKYQCVVTLHEFLPPATKPATGTPSTATTNTTAGATQQPAAQDAQQAEIAALMAQAAQP